MSQLTIPKPCHENWNKMTPQEKGRHCDVCQKVVKDFTRMSTDEILTSLKESTGNVCGRVNVEQLTPINKKQKVFFWVQGTLIRKMAWSGMAFLGFAFLFKNKAVAQRGEVQIKGKIAYQPDEVSQHEVTVLVVSKKNTPIAGAEIQVYSGDKLIQTLNAGPDGTAKITIDPDQLINKQISLDVFTNDGLYKHMEDIQLTKLKQTVRITMDEMHMIMGDISFIPEPQDTVKVVSPEKVTHDSLPLVNTTGEQPVLVYPPVCPGLPVIEELYTIPVMPEDTTIPFEETVEQHIRPDSRFGAFPVPAWDYVTIESLDENTSFSFEVFDNNGRKIQVVRNIAQRHTVDVSQWAPGIYYVLLFIHDKAIETKKIIVAK